MYKQDLALDNLQWLICHKTKPNQTKPNQNVTLVILDVALYFQLSMLLSISPIKSSLIFISQDNSEILSGSFPIFYLVSAFQRQLNIRLDTSCNIIERIWYQHDLYFVVIVHGR